MKIIAVVIGIVAAIAAVIAASTTSRYARNDSYVSLTEMLKQLLMPKTRRKQSQKAEPKVRNPPGDDTLRGSR